MTDRDRGIFFTRAARRNLKLTFRDPYFRDMDSDLIYRQLMKKIRFVPFGDHLKRFIYQKENMTEPFDEVPLTVYQKYIVNHFLYNQVPGSFTPTTAKLGALARNWLTQAAVRREVVLLLGFGLEMTPDEVNAMLTKALLENRLDEYEPFEWLLARCYENKYPFSRYLAVRERYIAVTRDASPLRPDEEFGGDLEEMLKVGRNTVGSLYLKARLNNWNRLYAECQHLIAGYKNSADEQDTYILAGRVLDRQGDAVSLEERRRLMEKERDGRHIWQTREIRESDMEHILYAGLPVDKNGNLVPLKDSALSQTFQIRRLTRQHINDIQAGKTLPSRFDLITLAFLKAAVSEGPSGVKERYLLFLDNTNVMLSECGMMKIYPVNPYESFILLCILSMDPLTTFNDVWELSVK